MLPNLRRFLAIYRGYEHHFFISQILLGIAALFTLFIPMLSQYLVDEGLIAGDRTAVFRTVLWMVVFAAVSAVFTMANAWYAVGFSEHTAHVVRLYLYKKIQTFSFGNFDRFPTSNLLGMMVSDVNAIKEAVLQVVTSLVQAPVMVLGAIVLVYRSTPSLVWILWIALALMLIALGVFINKMSHLFEVQQGKMDAVNNVLQEDLSGIRVVKAFVQEQYETRRYDRANQEFRKASLKPVQYAALLQPMLYLVVNLGTVAVFWFGGLGNLAGEITAGQIFAFAQYLGTILIPLVTLANILPQVTAAEASAERMFKVMDEITDVQNSAHPQSAHPEVPQGRIVFEQVSFRYPNQSAQSEPVLKDINLTIEPGQTVAFLGATGAGKSTLVNLIPRFYDVTQGRITIDGIDVREMDLEQLHALCGIALQESVLFSGKVRDNLCYGNPDTPEDDMIAAAKAADAHSFVSAIPEGYDAAVARRGTNFSGGQRQRLAIARSLTTKPKILILDDSTSALDMSTEARVQDAIQDLVGSTTTIFVAQRISTVITADRIFLMEAGEIIAAGTHEELLKTNPLYQEICNSQLGGVTA